MNKTVINEISTSILNVEQTFDILRALKPINLLPELERFSKEYQSGSIYNPVFRYDPEQKEIAKAALYKLEQISRLMTQVDSPRLEFFLSEKVEEIVDFCRLVSVIGDDETFPSTAIRILQQTTISDVDAALKDVSMLDNTKVESSSDFLTAEEFCATAKKELLNISEDWKIKTGQISAKVNVDSANSIILVNTHETFTKEEILRLLVHEIWTHVLRVENGRNQPLSIFQTGLAKSLSTEEGLAVYSEQINGLLDHRAIRLYCARVLACYLSQTQSFHDIYSAVNKIAPEDALHITHRVKRGMVNTCKAGGFTKDKVYYLGWKEVSRFFGNNSKLDRKFLYCGPIGLHHLSMIRESIKIGELVGDYKLPPFFDKLAKATCSLG